MLRSTAPTEKHNGQPTSFREESEACASNGLPPPCPSSSLPDEVDDGVVVAVFVDEDVLEDWGSVCDVVCESVVDDVGCADVVKKLETGMVNFVVAVAVDCVEDWE